MAKKKKVKKTGNLLYLIGSGIFLLGLLIAFLNFFPTLKEEAKYDLRKTDSTYSQPIKPIDSNFGIVIPKIQANSKVIDNVDPFDSQQYQIALTKGVAHAIGTAYPGDPGNDFIFAHSSVNWYVANQYNSVFYLAHKLDKGDEIDLYYKNVKYKYIVSDKLIVDPSSIQYLNNHGGTDSMLILMTCYPPGTSLKRLIILARQTI